MVLQQISEEVSGNKKICINLAISDILSPATSPKIIQMYKHFLWSEPQPSISLLQDCFANHAPTVSLGMPNNEIQQQSGFHTEECMLLYIFVACDGDPDIISARSSSLSWYQEWFLHSEIKWGKTITNVWDVWGIGKIVSAKDDIASVTHRNWQMFACYMKKIKSYKKRIGIPSMMACILSCGIWLGFQHTFFGCRFSLAHL